MAGGKETPRQKMIGMMYLVLTALLAMNISKDVLNAFIQINRGLVENSENSEERADATMGLLNAWSDATKGLKLPWPHWKNRPTATQTGFQHACTWPVWPRNPTTGCWPTNGLKSC